MEVVIKGIMVEINVRRSRRSRRLRLAVYPGGIVKLTAPYSMNEARLDLLARKFVLEKGEWLLRAINKLKRQLPAAPKRSAAEVRKEYKAHKDQVKQLVKERLTYFNQFYNFKIGNVTIRNQKSRWGSCSRKGNLNFNYRIGFLPQHLADYIVVHELCHIGQLNHSAKFWHLVAQTIPDYKVKRKELKSEVDLL